MAKKLAVIMELKGAFVMPPLPKSLKLDPMLAALLQTMSFLELSDDETVDPDYAIEAMESASGYLQRLSPPQLDIIHGQLVRVAAYARKKRFHNDFITFIGDFLTSAGIGALEFDEE